jgi:glucuronokinase
LAGSSAIVTAAMQAMMQFYSVEIPKPLLANLILSVEKDELKIGAGLQDRVAQVYACPVFMNFDKSLMEQQGFGDYIPFDKSLLPPLFIAYRRNLSEGSEVTHNDLASRFAKGEPQVLQAMQQWASLTEQAFERLNAGDKNIADLLNANFDLRNQLIKVSEGNKQMVMTARAVGASAKFTGSGGAIIGTYTDEKMLDDLVQVMKTIDAEVIIPTIV